MHYAIFIGRRSPRLFIISGELRRWASLGALVARVHPASPPK